MLLRYIVEEVLSPVLVGYYNYFKGTPLTYYLYDNLYFALPAVACSSILWVLVKNSRLARDYAIMNEQKKESELRFLKAQVNPHFIFNTLNNIYSMVYHQQKESLPAIESLANMMRFTTYESAKDKIPLQAEIDYIHNYIVLEKLRHENTLYYEFKVTADKEVWVPPFLFSPFIENSFKHGVHNDQAHPIKINLSAAGNKISFFIANKIDHQEKDSPGGLGLENTRQRLAIYFPRQHQLKINNDGLVYSIHLTITLS